MFQKAFDHLKKKEFTQAEELLSEGLNQNPQSESIRYNLAYTFFLKGEEAKALAYQRQVLFQNPYYKHIIKEKKTWFLFWLYVPSDFVWAVLFIMSCIQLAFLYKKKYKVFWFWLVPWIIIHGIGGTYAYHRYNADYVTLIQNTFVLSAPDLDATVLFEQKAGSLLRIKETKGSFSHIQNNNKQGGWISSQILIPVKIKTSEL